MRNTSDYPNLAHVFAKLNAAVRDPASRDARLLAAAEAEYRALVAMVSTRSDDTKRLDLLSAYLDAVRFDGPVGARSIMLDCFVGDGGGHACFTGADLREATDKALAQFTGGAA
jgi:hypothetical protein